jgi:hypothetical protein
MSDGWWVVGWGMGQLGCLLAMFVWLEEVTPRDLAAASFLAAARFLFVARRSAVVVGEAELSDGLARRDAFRTFLHQDLLRQY